MNRIPDNRRRKRPKDPYARLYCMKCQKDLPASRFYYSTPRQSYGTQCRDCTNQRISVYRGKRSLVDPAFVETRRDEARRGRERRRKVREEGRDFSIRVAGHLIRTLQGRGIALREIERRTGLALNTLRRWVNPPERYVAKLQTLEAGILKLERLEHATRKHAESRSSDHREQLR